MASKAGQLATAIEFYRAAPLYEEVAVERIGVQAFLDVRLTVDLHCPGCTTMSVFQFVENQDMVNRRHLLASPIPVGSFFEVVRFTCGRLPSHLAGFLLYWENGKLQKAGQYPSLRDAQESEARRYTKVSKDDAREYATALGLASHGIGIGAFVYLRRIVERQLDAAAKRRKEKEAGWDIDAWRGLRAKEKIHDLRGYIPDFLANNAGVYGILSLGLHELEEDDCRRHFEVVRAAVEAILEEQLSERERVRRSAEASAEIQKLQAKMKSEQK